jgi:alkaline phosphatase
LMYRILRFIVSITLVVAVSYSARSPELQSSPDNTSGANGPAKNIIFMIGDGMGLTQITAGMYSARRPLNMERFQKIGLQKTHSDDDLITDSAASAAAMARGIKANNGTFGSTLRSRAPKSILEEFDDRNLATGIVVTSSVTHATPAAFFTYQMFRTMNEEIALDYLKVSIDLIIGGGKKYFDRRTTDNLDLVAKMKDKGYKVKSFLDGTLKSQRPRNEEPFIYFTADSEPLPKSHGRDYLPFASQFAADFLKKRSDRGFFLLIEGSQIDWGGHANVSDMIIEEVQDFDEAVGHMLDFAISDGSTLLVVTADHETGGYSIIKEDEGKLVTHFATKTHTATMVPVFAYGPGSELFQGIYDNTEIYFKLKQASGIDINGYSGQGD